MSAPSRKSVSSRKGMKLKSLSLQERVKVLARMDAGASMCAICAEFDIKSSTFYPFIVYHWCEVRLKMYVMNIGRSGQNTTIPKLSEEAAIELGGNLLGEGVIFGIAVAILTFEVTRQKEKEKKKEEAEQAFIDNLENRINELTFASEELDTKLREVTRLAFATQHELRGRQVSKSTHALPLLLFYSVDM
ncbi:putative OPA3-like protein CG13603 [Chionoecetes opilio]|uniref:Putative OPA3-like protein CG13603 n=1 Tax=Chionoecetes opilio TaxID=41210 RepID=A0A8J5D635_CHIOP|nr:putative OPA3-like protein CG13603 [Chionoecetes opilio]